MESNATLTPLTDGIQDRQDLDIIGEADALASLARKLETDRAALVAALESAAASLQQFVEIGRIPENNKGLRDARATLAQVQS